MIMDLYSRPWTGLTREAGRPARPVVVECDHESPDQNLCSGCGALLAGVLDDVPALIRDLTDAEVKDVRFVEHGAFQADRTETEAILPWNERASTARTRLTYELTEASSACGLTRDTPPNSARRLRRHVPILSRRPDAQQWAARITHAAATAHTVIDRPPSPWYYGPCPGCGKDLYQERASDEDPDATIVCKHPECGYKASLSEHRLTQLDAGEDRMLTVSELVGAITSAGETVTRHMINNWIRREGLPRESRTRPRLINGRMSVTEVWVYRLGDVRRMALEAEIRRLG